MSTFSTFRRQGTLLAHAFPFHTKDTRATPNTRSKRLGHAHTGREISLTNLCTESGAIVVTSLLEPAPSIIHGVRGPRGGGGARGGCESCFPRGQTLLAPSLLLALVLCLYSRVFEAIILRRNWQTGTSVESALV